MGPIIQMKFGIGVKGFALEGVPLDRSFKIESL